MDLIRLGKDGAKLPNIWVIALRKYGFIRPSTHGSHVRRSVLGMSKGSMYGQFSDLAYRKQPIYVAVARSKAHPIILS